MASGSRWVLALTYVSVQPDTGGTPMFLLLLGGCFAVFGRSHLGAGGTHAEHLRHLSHA